MSKLGKITYTGKSGAKYEFGIYTSDTDFKDDFPCVYLFTKRAKSSDGKFSHKLLYVGETEQLGIRLSGHHKLEKAKKLGMNCVCVHHETGEEARLDKETDLRHANPGCPCNDQ